MPILKQLVSGSSQTKRRSRMDLTREMISAPLGDFRHTMHVGRSGDAFGDTSFLSTRSGEAPREPEAFPRSPRPGLLSRTFRSSKRSQSVTRVDQQRDDALAAADRSPAHVKNAMSLPFLYDEEEDAGRADARVPKSLSSSPMRLSGDPDGRPSNGAVAAAGRALELHERSFGELTELPAHAYHYGGGMKKAESVMSFHIDLGPSMLGDILGVMEKEEEDDLGYEEGEGRASPHLSAHGEGDGEDGLVAVREEEEDDAAEEEVPVVVEVEKEKEKEEGDEPEPEATTLEDAGPPGASVRPPSAAVDPEPRGGAPHAPRYALEARPTHLQLHLDSCSVSSAGSAAPEEKPDGQAYAGDTDSATYSAPPEEEEEEEESNFSSFMEDDEDDEIHV